MSLLTITKLSGSVGAEVTGLDPAHLAADDPVGEAILDALGDNGVLVFPGLHLDPETQVEFCHRLGAIDYSSDGHHSVAGIYPVTLDKSKNSSAAYLRGTFDWHIDGCTPTGDDYPQKATVLSAKQVAERGGETEFASSYAAHDALTDDEKERYSSLRVVHSLEASQRRITPNPLRSSWRSGDLAARTNTRWCGRIAAAVSRWCWGLPPTTWWAWTSAKAAPCWPSCSTAQRCPTRSTATAGRSATPSSGTTEACCIGPPPMRRTRSV
ncbi:hypothetical protein MSTO_41980 [Mycobacterium stomatepiae]|uniref:TauD/TfdA-like domain-containing protein n=1 Tax=Mycobacterium stomatepiae TaxID=470076 RepID=A0A7I7QCF7_9MYCO|nr:hypothetical protein MSTO_41980 [Mycobacterium stomatepiae]